MGDIEGFAQLIPGSYKSDKPNNITGINKIQLKCDCNISSLVNGIREPISYIFALDKRPSQKMHNEPGIKLFEKVNKTVLSHFTFFVKDNDHRPVDFSGASTSFTCQLVKIEQIKEPKQDWIKKWNRIFTFVHHQKLRNAYETNS